METHIHMEEVGERVPCDLADGFLGYASEYGIPKFRKQGREDPGQCVYAIRRSVVKLRIGETGRRERSLTTSNCGASDDPYSGVRSDFDIQGVDDVLEEERHLHVEYLL